MRILLLTSLTMLAFASNSILTRLAIDGGHADPYGFAVVRVLAGAVILLVIVRLRKEKVGLRDGKRMAGAVSLAVYMIGFSLAYLTLDAGLGALILFGVVQITMFGHAIWSGRSPTAFQSIGAAIAFGGLLLASWPGPDAVADPKGTLAMVCAGIGWAAYTISGRSARTALSATAASFTLCLPFLLVALSAFMTQLSPAGWGLALLCGGLTSGLGYALWYTVLPALSPALAAIVQLSVPVLAIVAGALLLGEAITPTIVAAAVLVLSGIALATIKGSARGRRS